MGLRSEIDALIERWHGQGRSLYAVTPRFSLSASEGILDACAALLTEAAAVPKEKDTAKARALLTGVAIFLISASVVGAVSGG